MTVPSVDQVVTVIDQLQSVVELVSYKWFYIRRRKPQSILRFPDIDELQAVPGLMDTYTGFTEPPHGTCTPVQCEGFRYGLGAPATAKRLAKVILDQLKPPITADDKPTVSSKQRVRNAGAIPARKRACDVSPPYYLSGWSANSFNASLLVFRRR